MESVSEMLIRHARLVMRCLGAGHREKIYQNALIASLNRRCIPHRSEVSCPIWFMGQCIGMGRADLVIGDVVVEIKANKLAPSESSAQLKKYIQSLSKAEKKEFRGMVLNFNQKTVRVDFMEERIIKSEIFKRSLENAPTRPIPEIVKRRRMERESSYVETP